MAYRLARRADDDVRHIYREGNRLFGRRQADRYHDRLMRIFELLADHPRLARERGEITPPARIHPCGSHVIIYRIELNDDILILRVRHGREDWIGGHGSVSDE